MIPDLRSICMQLPPAAHILIWLSVLAWDYMWGKTETGSFLGTLLGKFKALRSKYGPKPPL